MNKKLLYILPFASSIVASSAFADAALESLFPMPAEIRQIIDQRCVFCHGEVIDGEAEIREDLDMSTDEKILETLHDLEELEEMIAEEEMPHEAKLSFRLRRRPEMKDRLAKIKDDYDSNGEKEKLLAWIRSSTSAE